MTSINQTGSLSQDRKRKQTTLRDSYEYREPADSSSNYLLWQNTRRCQSDPSRLWFLSTCSAWGRCCAVARRILWIVFWRSDCRFDQPGCIDALFFAGACSCRIVVRVKEPTRLVVVLSRSHTFVRSPLGRRHQRWGRLPATYELLVYFRETLHWPTALQPDVHLLSVRRSKHLWKGHNTPSYNIIDNSHVPLSTLFGHQRKRKINTSLIHRQKEDNVCHVTPLQ